MNQQDDLGEIELDLATRAGDRLKKLDEHSHVDRDYMAMAFLLQRAALEVRRLRVAGAGQPTNLPAPRTIPVESISDDAQFSDARLPNDEQPISISVGSKMLCESGAAWCVSHSDPG